MDANDLRGHKLPNFDSVNPKSLDVAEIAKRVRSEIRSKVKTGELPRAKYSVTISRFSGGRSLDVSISDVVFPVTDFQHPAKHTGSVFSLDRVVAQRKDPGQYLSENVFPRFTPAGAAVLETVNKIVDKYHRDDSDISTDYFNCNFYKSVGFSWGFESIELDRLWCGYTDANPEVLEVCV